MSSKAFAVFVVAIGTLFLAGCHCGLPAFPVAAVPLDGGHGYQLSGILGFSGELLEPADGAEDWILNWRFTFPTGGYAVEDIEVATAESFPEQVTIRFLVDTPAPGEIVTEAIVEVAGSRHIAVDAGAAFDIRIVELCNLNLLQ